MVNDVQLPQMHSSETIQYDPLLYTFPLPMERTFFPMGFPVSIATNSEAVLQAAEEVWGQFDQVFPETSVRIRFAVTEDSSGVRPPATMPRAQGNLFATVHSADNYMMADLERGFAFGWFTQAVAHDAGHFRYHFLEPAVYVMLQVRYLTPIHAACIGLDGSGVLLCGESGAGKTSLGYACSKRGWTYVADDASNLIRSQGDGRMIAGRPHHIRFRESARAIFPELSTRRPCLRASGKFDIESSTADLGIASIACHTRADHVVFLNRVEAAQARLSPYPRENAAALFERVLCIGDENTREAQRQSLAHLLQVPILELTYASFDDAEQCLRTMVSERSAT